MSDTTEQMSLKDRMSYKGRSQFKAGLRGSLSIDQLDEEIETELSHRLFTIPVADRRNQLVDGGRVMTLLIHVGSELEDIPSKDCAFALRGLGARVKIAECGYTDGLYQLQAPSWRMHTTMTELPQTQRNLRHLCSNASYSG